MRRIILNLAEFRSIVGGRALTYKIGGEKVELTIGQIPWVDLVRAVLDAMRPESDRVGPPDPPQAVEFLPRHRRNHGK
jgi:hypothetical protein